MTDTQELEAVYKASAEQMVNTGLKWLDNLVHGVTSGKVEKSAIEALLYRYALTQHKLGIVTLSDEQIRHIYSRLTHLHAYV